MPLSTNKLATVPGAVAAAVLLLGFAGPAGAAPPPGMRWSDHAWGAPARPQTTRPVPADLKGYGLQQYLNSQRRSAPGTARPAAVVPLYASYPRFYGYTPSVRVLPRAPVVTYPCR